MPLANRVQNGIGIATGAAVPSTREHYEKSLRLKGLPSRRVSFIAAPHGRCACCPSALFQERASIGSESQPSCLLHLCLLFRECSLLGSDLRHRDRAPQPERTRTCGLLALVAIYENVDRRLFLFIPDDARLSCFSSDGRCVANCVCVWRRLSVSGTT
jgi:hypothetical protein